MAFTHSDSRFIRNSMIYLTVWLPGIDTSHPVLTEMSQKF